MYARICVKTPKGIHGIKPTTTTTDNNIYNNNNNNNRRAQVQKQTICIIFPLLERPPLSTNSFQNSIF